MRCSAGTLALTTLLACILPVSIISAAARPTSVTTARAARAERLFQPQHSRRPTVPMVPQKYSGQGPAAAAAAAAAAAKPDWRRRELLTVMDAYTYSNQLGTMKRQTLQPAWAPLRVVFNTSFFYPSAANPAPDGDRACYAVGQWARRGDSAPSGAPPSGSASLVCPSGVCTQCERDATDNCWFQCAADNVLTTTDYQTVAALLASAADILAATFEVERVVGPLVLQSQYACGGLPPLDQVVDADLVLMVHARPIAPSSSHAAYASSCQMDQHGRPISGEVGITAGNLA